MRIGVRVLAGLVVLTGVGGLAADPAPTSAIGLIVDGPVQAATRLGDVLYIGGRFASVAPGGNALGTVYALSPVTGAATGAPAFPGIAGAVRAIVADGAGGYYVGGVLTTVGGSAAGHLVHVLANGSRDTGFAAPQVGAVQALARAGTALYVIGSLTTTPDRIVRLDAATGQSTAWAHGLPTTFQPAVVETAGTRVIVGGSAPPGQPIAYAFDAASGAPAWSATLGPTGYVSDVVLAGPRLIVAGAFLVAPDINGLAALDPATGVPDPSWTIAGGAAGAARLAAAGTTVYVTGNFSAIGGQPRPGYAAIDAATHTVLPWQPAATLPAAVDLVALPNGHLVVGGTRGATAPSLMQVNTAGTVVPWTPAAVATSVTALAVDSSGALVVGSTLAATGAVARANLAAVDLTTGAVLPWAPSADDAVHALAAEGDTVYAGGLFTAVAGQPRSRLAAIDATSGAVRAWTPAPISGVVRDIELDTRHVYALGPLSATGSDLRNLMRFDRTGGALDMHWRPQPFEAIDGALAGGEFLVAGAAQLPIRPVSTAGVVEAYDLVTARRRRLAFTDVGRVFALALAGDTVYATGVFTAVNGVARNNLAALDRRTGTVLSFNYAPGVLGGSGLTVADGRVVQISAGGGPHGTGVTFFTAVRADGTAAPWNPGYGQSLGFSGESRVATLGSSLVAMGAFASLGPPALQGLAVFALDGARGPTNLRFGRRGPVTEFVWDPAAHVPFGGYVLEAGTTPGATSFTLPLGQVSSFAVVVPPGIFFVRVRTLGAQSGSEEVSNEVVLRGDCVAAPPPPTGLHAAIGGSSVSLAWFGPDANVDRYRLEVGTAPGLANLLTLALPGAQTTFAAAAPAGTYFVRVRGENACGSSAASGEVRLTVGAGDPLPAAPTALTATVSGSTVALTWTPPPGPVTGYVVEAGLAAGQATLGSFAVGLAPGLVVNGVPPGVYAIRVRALSAAGSGPP